MAKNRYKLFFPQCDCCGANGVVVEYHGKLLVSLELPRAASHDEKMKLRHTIVNDKPPSLMRDLVAGWARQLEVVAAEGGQC